MRSVCRANPPPPKRPDGGHDGNTYVFHFTAGCNPQRTAHEIANANRWLSNDDNQNKFAGYTAIVNGGGISKTATEHDKFVVNYTVAHTFGILYANGIKSNRTVYVPGSAIFVDNNGTLYYDGTRDPKLLEEYQIK